LALEEIHNNGVVYRDLKPENLLLDNEGFIKVTDFGLSKLVGGVGVNNSVTTTTTSSSTTTASSTDPALNVENRTYTVCGTPHYLAPEIIQGTGHGKSVDLWCLGVLIYEMLTGRPPFYRSGERQGDHISLYRRITTCNIEPSALISPEAWDLINKLIVYKPANRLSGVALRSHPWFNGIDWVALQRRSIRAPIIPFIRTNDDLNNFNTTKTTTVGPNGIVNVVNQTKNHQNLSIKSKKVILLPIDYTHTHCIAFHPIHAPHSTSHTPHPTLHSPLTTSLSRHQPYRINTKRYIYMHSYPYVHTNTHYTHINHT
jgi:serine/threonine protein kinase